MNNLILQKHINAYQSVEYIYDNFYLPDHIKDKEQIEQQPFVRGLLQDIYKKDSLAIQQAAKFYIYEDGTSGLTLDEFETITDGLKIILPFESTFIQIEDESMFFHILCTDIGLKTSDEGEDIFLLKMWVYDKELRAWNHDMQEYQLCFHEDGSYTYWISEIEIEATNHLGERTKIQVRNWVDLSAGPDGHTYKNKSLNGFVQKAMSGLTLLNVMLAYPQIVDTKQIAGRKNIFLDSKVRMKDSALRSKPAFEHKSLKINMYDSAKHFNKKSNGKRSVGTKLHAVRKHLRVYESGHKTFVKSHFRGSKAYGVIQKDYEINMD